MKRIEQIEYTIVGILFASFALLITKGSISTGPTLAAIFTGVMLICYAWIRKPVIRGNVSILNIVTVDEDGKKIGQGREVDAIDAKVLVSLLEKKALFSIDSYDLDSEALQIFDDKGNRYIYIDKKNRENLRLGKLFKIKLDESELKIFFNILNKY